MRLVSHSSFSTVAVCQLQAQPRLQQKITRNQLVLLLLKLFSVLQIRKCLTKWRVILCTPTVYSSKELLLASLLIILACLTGCETWTEQRGVASLYGVLYPYTTLTDCLNLCLEMYTCVAVDISSDVCVVHTNINDTANTFNASDYIQYTLNRACLSSTATSSSSTTSTVEPTLKSTYIGNWYNTVVLRTMCRRNERSQMSNHSIKRKTWNERKFTKQSANA